MLHSNLASEIRLREENLHRIEGVMTGGIFVSFMISLIGAFWRVGNPSITLVLLGGCGVLSFSIGLVLTHSNHNNWVQKELEMLDLEWSTGDKDDLEALLIEMEKYRGKQMEMEDVGGGKKYRTRGMDEKGPDWGRSDSSFSGKMPRRDAVKGEGRYTSLEGPLTENEKLVREFDVRNAEKAQQRWEREESNDIDIIEAGVENLGDLVKSGFFEKAPPPGLEKKNDE